MKVYLVAIAKNEEKYLEEWLRFHVKVGFSRIILFDNESTDGTRVLAENLGHTLPVEVVDWPSKERASPQRSAYNYAIENYCQSADWVAFIDLDEFLVPWGYASLPEYLAKAPQDVSCVCINWMTYGSSGVADPEYGSVLDTFQYRGHASFRNNRHYKSIGRPDRIEEVLVHDVKLKSGRRVLSDFLTEIPKTDGRADPIFNGIQINHYQTKTRSEFESRMARGNANFPKGHPQNDRNYQSSRFSELDCNDVFDDCASIFREKFKSDQADQ